MEQLPIYINVVFILTTILAVWLLYKAANQSKIVIIILISWLIIQAAISLSGFYTVTNGTPPRFTLLLFPPIIFILLLFITKKGKAFIDALDVKTLTLIHIVRVPVEITLYWLFLHKAVPELMTFQGRNFDILCGLTAPFIYYYGYRNNILKRSIILAWNIVCFLLLTNIVITAVLSAPFSFQKFGFDQPNIALFYFPFTLLPCLVVPIAFFAHLATIRKLVNN